MEIEKETDLVLGSRIEISISAKAANPFLLV